MKNKIFYIIQATLPNGINENYICGRAENFISGNYHNIANRREFMKTFGFTNKKRCETVLKMARKQFPDYEMNIFSYSAEA